MRTKQLLTKTLLVVAGLLAGASSAWADPLNAYTTIDLSDPNTYTVTKYDFQNDAPSTNATNAYLTKGEAYGIVDKSNYNYNSYYTEEYGTALAFAELYTGVSGSKGYYLRKAYTDANRGLLLANADRSMTIIGLKAGQVIAIKGNANCVSSTFQGSLTSGSWVTDDSDASNGNYYYTITSDGDLNINFVKASSYVNSINIYKGKSPALTISGTSGTSRKFTLSCDDASATIYYSETEKAIGDAGWTEYTGEVTTSSETIWAYTATSKVSSAVASFATGAGTEIKLNAPYFSKSSYSAGLYTIYISQNQGSVSPAVGGTPTIKYSINGGDEQTYTDAFTAAPGSTITAYATYTGYGNSDEATCEPGVRPTYNDAIWSQDYRNLVTENNDPKSVVLSSTPFDVNGVNFNNIIGYTHNAGTVDVVVDSHVGLNTTTGFYLRHNGGGKAANSGILQNNSDQYIGLHNLTVGNIIIVTTNGNWIDPNYGVTFLSDISTSNEFYFQVDQTTASLKMYKGTYNYVYTISEIAPLWNAPTISEADAGEDGWTVTITGDPGATLSYKIGTGEYQTYSAPFNVAASTNVTAKASGGDYGESAETEFTTSVKKIATPTVAYASYNYEEGGYKITPSCAMDGVTFQYRIGGTGDFTDCTVPFYAKGGVLYVKAKKAGWTDSNTFTGAELNVAPSATSPETLIAFQKTKDDGDKNVDHIYKSVTITGGNTGAIAGIGDSGAKLKLRTNQSSNTITLNVNSGYKVTGVSISANSNNTGAAIILTSTTIDGGSNIMGENTTFPASGSDAVTYSTGAISASSSIVFTFNNSQIDGTDGKKNSQILASIEVTYMTPTEVEVANAIAECKKYETSPEFAIYIDGGSYASAAEVYAAHTSWQIEQAKAISSTDYSAVIINHAITSTDRYWGNLSDGSSSPYTGAPDNYYLTWNSGAQYSVWNGVYGLPAGKYTATTYTYSSIAGDRNQYIATIDPWGDINTGEKGGSREIANDAGWVKVTSTFVLDATNNLAFGVYCPEVAGRVAGFDNWTLTLNAISVTLDNSGYATLASAYPLNVASASMTASTGTATAYKAAIDGTVAKFTELDKTIPANTGILLKGTAGATVTIPVVASGTAVTENAFLVNTTGATFAGDGAYYYFAMKKNAATLTFNAFDPSTLAFPANKAYLKVLKTNFPGSAPALTFDFGEGETTGISASLNDKAEMTNDNAIYNLNGQRVAQPTKGLYIVNGKKVVVK